MVYQNDRIGKKFSNFLLLVEIILALPFSTAVVERGFSAVRRILTDWRSTLGPNLISDCLHFSTRKKELESPNYRERLTNKAVKSFLKGADRECVGGETVGGVVKRRINKLKSVVGEKPSYQQVIINTSDDIEVCDSGSDCDEDSHSDHVAVDPDGDMADVVHVISTDTEETPSETNESIQSIDDSVTRDNVVEHLEE